MGRLRPGLISVLGRTFLGITPDWVTKPAYPGGDHSDPRRLSLDVSLLLQVKGTFDE